MQQTTADFKVIEWTDAIPARHVVCDAENIRILINQGSHGIVIKNHGRLRLEIKAGSGAKVAVKLLAASGSESYLSGTAAIPADCPGAVSDISFSVLAAPDIKSLKISPAQRISSAPKSAEHSANLWRPAPNAVRYLETAGISDASDLLERVFLEEEPVIASA